MVANLGTLVLRSGDRVRCPVLSFRCTRLALLPLRMRKRSWSDTSASSAGTRPTAPDGKQSRKLLNRT